MEDCQRDIWVGTISNGIVRFKNDCELSPDCSKDKDCTISTEIDNYGDEINQVSVYPNPVSDKLILNFPTASVKRVIQIYDLNGRELNYIKTGKAQIEIEIDVSDLSKGIYLIGIESKEKTTRKKFLKK